MTGDERQAQLMKLFIDELNNGTYRYLPLFASLSVEQAERAARGAANSIIEHLDGSRIPEHVDYEDAC